MILIKCKMISHCFVTLVSSRPNNLICKTCDANVKLVSAKSNLVALFLLTTLQL